MCGILGVWNRDHKPIDLVRFQRSLTLLKHRGPDDECYLVADSSTALAQPFAGQDTDAKLDLSRVETIFGQSCDLALGFRRLSILDLSSLGHQPMASPDGLRWIVFNGEIYNYIELRETLILHGYKFRSNSDTEVILAAYDLWREACLDHFNGMWAFAIWDVQQRSLFCARDRLGIKPFHFACREGQFVFSSEMKALLEFLPPRANLPLMRDYLSTGALNFHPTETLFDGISSLPAGSWMRMDVNGNDPTPRQYWKLEQHDVPQSSSENAGQKLLELLDSAIALRLRSDVPVGTSLSGGIDSSAIVCLLNRRLRQSHDGKNETQKTVSAIYDVSRVDERQWIRYVTECTGVQAHFTSPGSDGLVANMEQLIWANDQPIGGSSGFAQWSVFREARLQGLPVMLEGQGSDELFGGYENSVAVFVASLLDRGQFIPAWQEFRDWRRRNASLPVVSFLRPLKQTRVWDTAESFWHKYMGNSNLPPYIDSSLANISGQGASHLFAERSPRQIRNLPASLIRLMTISSLPQILHSLDRNSMASAVEAREPYLDYRLVEFAFQLPDNYKVRNGWTKFILRNAMQGIIPEEIRWRRDKKGFPTPENEWYHHPRVLNFFSEILLSEACRKRGWLEPSIVEKNLRAFRNNQPGVSAPTLWRWVDSEMWARIFLDR